MPKLSLTMIVRNEHKHLERCLNSVADIVDEIIIVDTGSTDNTKEIATSFNAKIFDFKWIDDFSAARNYSLEQSTGDWNLVLDADEYIVNDCKDDIFRFIRNETAVGRVKRIDEFIQNSETKYSNVYLSRLIPKNINYVGRVHEQIDTDLPRKNVNIEVFHDGYVYNNKTGRNLGILLMELEEKPFDDYILYQIGKQYKLNNQLVEAESYFEKSYKLVRPSDWYKPGLIVDFLYVIIGNRSFKKGLEIIHKESKQLSDFPDFHFVCGLFYMDLIFHNINEFGHLLPKIEQAYLNCLSIGETNKYDSVRGVGSFLACYNLGVYYETLGKNDKAIYYYQLASKDKYQPAINRLRKLNK